jgi:uncharacterized membrane protein
MRRGQTVRGRGLLVRGFGVAALVAVLVLAGGAAGTHGPGQAESSPVAVSGVDIDPDSVLLQVTLGPGGTGEWRVEYYIRLDDENATEAFERHREEIEANESAYRDPFATDMRASATAAEDATDRAMGISNVTVNATRERTPGQRYGVIRYTFDWAGFAATNDTAIVAGDALGGLFLDDRTTLIVAWPAEYRRASVSPPPGDTRDRAVSWSGEFHFASETPRIVVSNATTPGGGTTAPGDGDTDADGDVLPASDGLFPLVVGMIVILGILAVAARQYLEGPRGDDGDASGDGRDASGGVGGESGQAAASGEDGTDDQPPPELLSNEEQVQSVLGAHDGRMKQQELAEELGWTDAKTSKVIRGMREDDAVDTFRLGRENVVTLPDTDLEESGT